MLKLQLKDKPESAIWLTKPEYLVGSAPHCDFIIDSLTAAKEHFKLICADNDKLSLDCCKSGRTTFINGVPVESETALAHNDQILIGNTFLEILDPKQVDPSTILDPIKAVTGKRYTLNPSGSSLSHHSIEINGSSELGSAGSCDIQLKFGHLEPRHASVTALDNGLLIKNLSASNTCFINGDAIDTGIAVHGDAIMFGSAVFLLDDPQQQDRVNTPRLKDISTNVFEPENLVPAEDKVWKTKPTSRGNRSEEEEIVPHIEGISNGAVYLIGIALSAIMFAGIYYWLEL